MKKYLKNKEMSDPNWIHQKQQDFFNLKAALDRFEWGSSYLPVTCHSSTWHIRKEIERMDEPIKSWKVETPIWIKLKK